MKQLNPRPVGKDTPRAKKAIVPKPIGRANVEGRVGKCCMCGGDAAWNTPYIDKDLKLYCNTCARASKKMLYGVEQFTERGQYRVNPGHMSFVKDHCSVSVTTNHFGVRGTLIYLPNFVFSAYTHDGGRVFPLTDKEKAKFMKNPEAVLDMMVNLIRQKKTRCTDCGKTIPEKNVAGYPLFAGCNCDECWEKHNAHLEEERRHGHICGSCGQPYGNCCC